MTITISFLLVSCSNSNSTMKDTASNPPKEVQVSWLSDVDPIAKIAPPGDITVVSKLTDSVPPK